MPGFNQIYALFTLCYISTRDWKSKVGKDACKNWENPCGLYSNNETNERDFRLLEFANLNGVKLAITFGFNTNSSRRWTWYSLNGEHNNQVGQYHGKKALRNQYQHHKDKKFSRRSYIRSDHNLVVMTFKPHLKKVKKTGTR